MARKKQQNKETGEAQNNGATTEAANKKGKKNPDLPGMTGDGVAHKTCEAVEIAANDYVALRDARQLALKLEIESKKNLLATMQANNLQTYRFDDKLVEVCPADTTPTVKVKKAEVDEIELEENEE